MALPSTIENNIQALRNSVIDVLHSASEELSFPEEPLWLSYECWNMELGISIVIECASILRQIVASNNCSSGTSEAGSLEDCPICLEPLYPKTTVSTDCGHLFHLHCIMKHLRMPCEMVCDPVCPLWRAALDESDILSSSNGFDEHSHFWYETVDLEADFEKCVDNLLESQVACFHALTELASLCLRAAYGKENNLEISQDHIQSLAESIVCMKQFEASALCALWGQLMRALGEP